jgi:hypothetical protein
MSTDKIVATLAELDNYTVGSFPNSYWVINNEIE